MCELCRKMFLPRDAIIVMPYGQVMCHVWCVLLRWQDQFGRN
jgi:hypothetical protein